MPSRDNLLVNALLLLLLLPRRGHGRAEAEGRLRTWSTSAVAKGRYSMVSAVASARFSENSFWKKVETSRRTFT